MAAAPPVESPRWVRPSLRSCVMRRPAVRSSLDVACHVAWEKSAKLSVSSAPKLTEFVHRRIGPFSIKDFRTWGGTLRAAIVLAELGPAVSETEAKRNVALAMRIVASELGNTPAICRSSYVHPMVLARYLDEGETISIRSAAQRRHAVLAHSPEEKALIAFLDEHFRERRRPSRRPQMARAA